MTLLVEREVTDSLVDLLITTVHRIGARAEQKVTNELINAFKRASGKKNILFAVAEASLAEPDGEVREVVFPAVRGGEQTLKERPPTGSSARSRPGMTCRSARSSVACRTYERSPTP
ncbi:hypothetical protein HFP71_37825 [Streptomyces sp. ARC32]